MTFRYLFELERELDVSLLTPEMQACAYLFDHGPAPSHHLQAAIRTSPAGFHNVKRRLKDSGLIVGNKCPNDARVMLYDLSASARDLLKRRVAARGEGQPVRPHTFRNTA